MKALGSVKWFNVRNGYFINRDDTEKGIFVQQTAIKKNSPRKYLLSVDDGQAVEFDVFEDKMGVKALVVKRIEMGKWEEDLNWRKGGKQGEG